MTRRTVCCGACRSWFDGEGCFSASGCWVSMHNLLRCAAFTSGLKTMRRGLGDWYC